MRSSVASACARPPSRKAERGSYRKRSARGTRGRLVWIPRFTFTTLTTNSTELPRHKRADCVSQGWLELRVRVTHPPPTLLRYSLPVVKKSLWTNLDPRVPLALYRLASSCLVSITSTTYKRSASSKLTGASNWGCFVRR